MEKEFLAPKNTTSRYTLNPFFTRIFAQNNILSLKKIISEIRPTVCEKYFFNCARFENKKIYQL